MRVEDLKRLRALAEMKRDIDLLDLSRIAGQMARLQADINGIRSQARARAESIDLDPARLSGVDVHWETWVSQTIRRLQQRMAELAIEREGHMQKARLSFGRADVLRHLSEDKTLKLRRPAG